MSGSALLCQNKTNVCSYKEEKISIKKKLSVSEFVFSTFSSLHTPALIIKIKFSEIKVSLFLRFINKQQEKVYLLASHAWRNQGKYYEKTTQDGD